MSLIRRVVDFILCSAGSGFGVLKINNTCSCISKINDLLNVIWIIFCNIMIVTMERVTVRNVFVRGHVTRSFVFLISSSFYFPLMLVGIVPSSSYFFFAVVLSIRIWPLEIVPSKWQFVFYCCIFFFILSVRIVICFKIIPSSWFFMIHCCCFIYTEYSRFGLLLNCSL